MKSDPSYTKRFIIARLIGSAYFWGSISIPFLVIRGFTISEAFSLIALYSLLVVVLEFPTGVIGDYFGHKLSINLANILGVLSFLIMAQPIPHYAYYLLIFLAATSSALVSGSDIAYLHTISTNFKKDLANLRTYSTVVAFVSLSLAGYFATLSLTLPLYLMSASWFISAILIHSLPNLKPRQFHSGNIYLQAGKAFRTTFASIPILGLMLYTAVNNGFELSIKTIINSFGTNLGFGLTQVSLIVGFSFLARALGLHFAKHFETIRTRFLFISIAFSMLVLTILTPSYLSLIILSLISFLVAVISLRADFAINDLIPDHLRASILSLRNLLVRLFSALYLTFSGQLLSNQLFQLLIFVTLVIYAITGISFLKIINFRYANKAHSPANS